ncbi:hypothetical protein [Terrabacter sp. 2RAF25]|uniref:hypothetical protein n=1 Tax=Terrabacter sp. 2RAF25 TaxID=3232998 RepID=UPI003F98727B
MIDERSKPGVVAAIADLLGAPTPPSANGSREPKEILLLINDRLGLGFDNSHSKPALAQEIVQAAGLTWTPECWSRPMTLTREGLLRLETAVKIFLDPRLDG